MHSRIAALTPLSVALAFGLVAPVPETMADVRPHAGMLRYPDVSRDQIAFSYANDLWLAPREGGIAVPLASPPGVEFHPRFSPDGKTVAFVGNYDGNQDLYTIGVDGGVPVRVTHHPGGEALQYTIRIPANGVVLAVIGRWPTRLVVQVRLSTRFFSFGAYISRRSSH
ncbi:MAG: PD40 domain-containing protein [Phycisphaerales bacterium]|nr:MAG: PD40 domain-containing protein [Phycisphaerales bacterium]